MPTPRQQLAPVGYDLRMGEGLEQFMDINCTCTHRVGVLLLVCATALIYYNTLHRFFYCPLIYSTAREV